MILWLVILLLSGKCYLGNMKTLNLHFASANTLRYEIFTKFQDTISGLLDEIISKLISILKLAIIGSHLPNLNKQQFNKQLLPELHYESK